MLGHGSLRDVLNDADCLDQTLATPRGFPPGLRILAAGPSPATLAGLPQPWQVANLIRRACELAELVIVDAAPLGSFGDSIPLVAVADLTLLVVRIGRTQLDALTQAGAELDGAANAVVIVGGLSVQADYLAPGAPALLPPMVATATA